MSDIKARFVGHPDGAFLPNVPVEDGTTRSVTVPHGGELPAEIDGLAVPAAYRDSLLEQKDNWTQVRRNPAKTTTAANAEDKEG
jgi:hypothetical protein